MRQTTKASAPRARISGIVLNTVTASSSLSDAAICDALASGEAWAAAAIYDRVAGVVTRVLCRILGGGDIDRNDLAQEAFERVITSVTSGRFARSCDLQTWSAVITQHVALDALRRRKRERLIFARQEDTALDVASPAHTPEKTLEVRRRFERLVVALQSMRQARAEALVLYNVLGYDLAAIARITGVSVAAVQSRLVRGRGDVLRRIRAQERSDK